MLLKNVKTLVLNPPSIGECNIRINDGIIAGVSSKLKAGPGEEVVVLSDAIVMPGFVCAHTHLYSALSRGMPGPVSKTSNFIEILRNIWWKLDESLDEESIYYSALVGAIESAKLGTTMLIDHHASPNHIRGSLDVIKQGISKVGLRGILCYETTDRGGVKRRDAGLEENERFVTENTNNNHFRGTMGAHASLTLVNDSLKRIGELAALYDCGVHIHVAEDEADGLDSEKRYRIGLVERMKKFGVLRKKSIFAHGIHLSKEELTAVDRAGAWIVHNPRSNMNNAVGHAPVQWFGDRSALGTDGFPSDMFEEAKFGYFRCAESKSGSEVSRIPRMLHNGQRLISEFFGQSFGTIAKGSPADLVVLEYRPPTPLTERNAQGHFLFGMNSGMVRDVMVAGKWIVRDRKVIGVDEHAVFEKAVNVAGKLWARMKRNR